jgi:hypothetical protein
VGVGYQPSEAFSEPPVPLPTQDVGLATGPAAIVPSGRLRRLVQGLPWRVATIVLGVILTIVWTAILIWVLRWLLSVVI